MIRRFGEAPDGAQTYRLRPGVYALLQQGNALLLTLQEDPEPDLQLPGGGIDPGETSLAALHREVYEETGWTLSGARRVGAFRRFTFMPEYGFYAEKLCHIYHARPAMQKGPPLETGHTALWLPIADAAATLGNAGDRHFADQLLK